jgi:hypothetical protein
MLITYSVIGCMIILPVSINLYLHFYSPVSKDTIFLYTLISQISSGSIGLVIFL